MPAEAASANNQETGLVLKDQANETAPAFSRETCLETIFYLMAQARAWIYDEEQRALLRYEAACFDRKGTYVGTAEDRNRLDEWLVEEGLRSGKQWYNVFERERDMIDEDNRRGLEYVAQNAIIRALVALKKTILTNDHFLMSRINYFIARRHVLAAPCDLLDEIDGTLRELFPEYVEAMKKTQE